VPPTSTPRRYRYGSAVMIWYRAWGDAR